MEVPTMYWPSRGKPELHRRGKWWVVRWYHPVIKQCRSLRTLNEEYAKAMFELIKKDFP